MPNATIDQKIASGFNRNHLLNGEGGAIAEEQRFVNLFDRMDTTATTWLGLTMACAQCHDHKYDPITMRDYYSLLDAFNRVPEIGHAAAAIGPNPRRRPVPRAAHRGEQGARSSNFETEARQGRSRIERVRRQGLSQLGDRSWMTAIPPSARICRLPLAKVLAKAEDDRTDAEKKSLEPGLRKHFDEKVRAGLVGSSPALAKMDQLEEDLADYKGDQVPRVMIMSDAKPRETKHPGARRISQAQGEGRFCHPRVSAAAAQGRCGGTGSGSPAGWSSPSIR